MIDKPRDRLASHLARWLGRWPLPVCASEDAVNDDTEVLVVGCAARTQPGWDGAVHAVMGVVSPAGGVLSVPPDQVAKVRRLGGPAAESVTVGALRAGLAEVMDRAEQTLSLGIFRWCETPADLPDAGEWVSTSDPRLPSWLRPFNGDVLIAWDEGGHYGAGVGRKMHDGHGHELAVGTEEALRGRGIARRLVAQAARRVLDDGAVPTYLHDADNVASGHVAQAAGFPDRGWRVIGV